MELNKEIDFMESITKLVVNKQAFIDYLLYLREEYRTQRGRGVDEGNRLLHYTYAIDEIVSKVVGLEKELEEQQMIAKEEYNKKLEAQQKKNNI